MNNFGTLNNEITMKAWAPLSRILNGQVWWQLDSQLNDSLEEDVTNVLDIQLDDQICGQLYTLLR